jgi:hypothetical protein
MRAAAGGLVLLAAVAGLLATASAHRGPIPKYTYGEGCDGFIDPVGILFYGRDASATRSAEISEAVYEGMEMGDDDSQHFVTHGNCMSTQRSVDDGCFTCNRTHMRIGGIRSPSGRYARDRKGRIYSVGTPHTDEVRFCGALPHHVNPENGFRDARRRFVEGFRNAGYTVTHQRIKNTRRRQQCDGSYAQGDGLIAKVRTTR